MYSSGQEVRTCRPSFSDSQSISCWSVCWTGVTSCRTELPFLGSPVFFSFLLLFTFDLAAAENMYRFFIFEAECFQSVCVSGVRRPPFLCFMLTCCSSLSLNLHSLFPPFCTVDAFCLFCRSRYSTFLRFLHLSLSLSLSLVKHTAGFRCTCAFASLSPVFTFVASFSPVRNVNTK